MGFPKEECSAALKAAFGNHDRAVEYLLNGIPEDKIVQEDVNNPAEKLIADLNKLPQLEEIRTRLQNDPSSLPEILHSLASSAP